MDVAVAVEPVDLGHQHLLGGLRRQVDPLGSQAQLGAGLLLLAHVDPRGRIIPHQHEGKPRRDPPVGQRPHPLGNLGADFSGDGLAIDDLRGHLTSLWVAGAMGPRSISGGSGGGR